MGSLDMSWAEEVCRICDPVFEAADVGFVRHAQHPGEGPGPVKALLWEADPARFAAKYPDSGVIESYGEEQWPGVHCIDYWVYVEHDKRRCRLSVEGWNLPEIYLDMSGDPSFDGVDIADTMARILGVPSPRL